MGHGLREWAEDQLRYKNSIPFHMSSDSTRSHVLGPASLSADVFLAGNMSYSFVKERILSSGAHISGEAPWYLNGLLQVEVTPEQACRLADIRGVHSVIRSAEYDVQDHMARLSMDAEISPTEHNGRVPSEPLISSLNAAQLHSRYKGKGQTVAVISESFDWQDGAKHDIEDGNLPGESNAVVVVSDGMGADEGRAMMQVVHSLAPEARLCFLSTLMSSARLAQAIFRLPLPPCAATIIVADTALPSSPYHDDVIDAAVDYVVNKHNVLHFSAANNGRNNNFDIKANFVAASDARVPSFLKEIPQQKEWHYFGQAHDFLLPMANAPSYRLYWNDPRLDSVENDLDLYIFNSSFSVVASSLDDNVQTGMPSESIHLFPSLLPSSSLYYAAIGRSSSRSSTMRSSSQEAGPSSSSFQRKTRGAIPAQAASDSISSDPAKKASDLRFAISSVLVPRSGRDSYGPTVREEDVSATGFGIQSGARQTITIGAHRPDNWRLPQHYSSLGPVLRYFDSKGSLISPEGEVRLKPEFTAPDCAPNSFFSAGSDIRQSGWPVFCGSSASVPAVAGIAALLREKNPTLTRDQIVHLLRASGRSELLGRWTRQGGFGAVDADSAFRLLDSKGQSYPDFLLPGEDEAEAKKLFS
eukprot:CAMPEP_0184660956 /NCGR_PEP_ID=MMETSP0308-20130426/36262_1 /TAXON_ID=38269 /ORGANISM="Gloeochaete witrockiana, Strain SAG 46.84" /LENGTH=640 /DNA_ID=CAMNT_0027101921 /DNA_START=151 /DNA_END=2073 /DNA_ORIENTATION=+